MVLIRCWRIHGERGSSKSTLSTIVRKLIDPRSVPLISGTRSARSLMMTAANGWLLTIDNVSTLPNWLSNGLCSLATGGGDARSASVYDRRSNVIYVDRPVVLTESTISYDETTWSTGRVSEAAADLAEQAPNRG